MSNETEEGVQEVKTAACDKLLQARVDARMAGKKVGVVPWCVGVSVCLVCVVGKGLSLCLCMHEYVSVCLCQSLCLALLCVCAFCVVFCAHAVMRRNACLTTAGRRTIDVLPAPCLPRHARLLRPLVLLLLLITFICGRNDSVDGKSL